MPNSMKKNQTNQEAGRIFTALNNAAINRIKKLIVAEVTRMAETIESATISIVSSDSGIDR